MPGTSHRTLEERLWEKVDRRAPDECWPWLGFLTDGYGMIWLGVEAGRKAYSHRVVYELLVGSIPEGLQLDHLCRVRHCVNPAHLELVTSRENTMRGLNPQRTRERHATRTHCIHGHEFTPENTRIGRRGRWAVRICKACELVAQRRYRQRKREAA